MSNITIQAKAKFATVRRSGFQGEPGKSAYSQALEANPELGKSEEEFGAELADSANKLSKSVYDPNGKNADAFDRTKHTGAMPLSGYGELGSVSLPTLAAVATQDLSQLPVVIVNRLGETAPYAPAAYLPAPGNVEPPHDFKAKTPDNAWKEMDFSGTVRVGAFGFTGTDPAADTAAFAKALNALRWKTHKLLWFPACDAAINPAAVVTGTGQGISFIIDDSLSNLTILGAGMGLTRFMTASNKHTLFVVRGGNMPVLRDLTISNPPRLYGGESMLSTLPGSLAANASLLTVTSGTESAFPGLTEGDHYHLILKQGGAQETIRVTAVSGATLTVERGKFGTVPLSFTVGAQIWQPTDILQGYSATPVTPTTPNGYSTTSDGTTTGEGNLLNAAIRQEWGAGLTLERACFEGFHAPFEYYGDRRDMTKRSGQLVVRDCVFDRGCFMLIHQPDSIWCTGNRLARIVSGIRANGFHDAGHWYVTNRPGAAPRWQHYANNSAEHCNSHPFKIRKGNCIGFHGLTVDQCAGTASVSGSQNLSLSGIVGSIMRQGHRLTDTLIGACSMLALVDVGSCDVDGLKLDIRQGINAPRGVTIESDLNVDWMNKNGRVRNVHILTDHPNTGAGPGEFNGLSGWIFQSWTVENTGTNVSGKFPLNLTGCSDIDIIDPVHRAATADNYRLFRYGGACANIRMFYRQSRSLPNYSGAASPIYDADGTSTGIMALNTDASPGLTATSLTFSAALGTIANLASGAVINYDVDSSHRFRAMLAGVLAEYFRISAGGISMGGGINAEALRAVPVANAVNRLEMRGAIAGGNPTLTPAGSDTDISTVYGGKGMGGPIIGTSSGYAAFFGGTPVQRRAGAAQAPVATTASTNSAPYGFATAAQADAIVTLVNELRAALVGINMIKGSA